MPGMRSRHRYHCRECRRRGRSNYRFTKRYGPGHYKTDVKCPRCKTTDNYSYEAMYLRAQARRYADLCTCNPVPHPHNRSHYMCLHTTSTRVLDDNDYEHFHLKVLGEKDSKHRRTSMR